MKPSHFLLFAGKFLLLTFLFLVFYLLGAFIFTPPLPAGVVLEPGPIPEPYHILVVGAAHTFVLMLVILRSRWSGWPLILATIFAYYGCVTVMMQIETAYFLTNLTVGPQTLINLFLMAIPPALLFIPLATWILGKGRRLDPDPTPNERLVMPAGQWAWKLAVIVVAYVLLYLSAGYFIAWQNPELRAFYGGADPGSFFLQVRHILLTDPWLVPFQMLRALLWVVFLLPVIRMARGRLWQVALVVALLVSVPQNVGHILPNPFIPANSVRLSHMLETASSTFVFGLVVAWLLYRRHHSFADLFGLARAPVQEPAAKPLT